MKIIKRIIQYFKNLFPRHKTPEEFYNICVDKLGTKFVKSNEYGSAEMVNFLYKSLTGNIIGGELSTYELFWFLQNRKKFFKQVEIPDAGDIIISPTGCGPKEEDIGNVGIIGPEGQIFSINKSNGKFDNHLEIKDWLEKYKGFPIKYFRLK
jgi:hypothetical protein